MRINRIGVVMIATALAVIALGCGAKNEFPDSMRGRYQMTRLLGTDNVTITVDKNSMAMAECDVNCPDATMRFTKIDCTSSAGHNTCQVESADCTGTVEEAAGVGHSLAVSLTAKPGLSGAAAEHRQVNCYQYSDNGITAL